MSTAERAVPPFLAPGKAPPRKEPFIGRLLPRLTPREGWLTLILLLLVLLTVVWSVQQADWVDTPGLPSVIVIAALTALLLAKVRAPFPLLHLAGLALGFVVVVWQATPLTSADSLVPQVQELWMRVRLWTDAATSGGISTDLLPFSLIIMTSAWITGYVASWSIFRRGNVWVAILPGGIGILTNLSYLPGRFAPTFFLFVLVSMLLVVRMNLLQRESSWRKARISFSRLMSWFTLHDALWFSLFVVILAALLPLKGVTVSALRDGWRDVRWPAERLEGEFVRLFSGVPARKPTAFRTFGRVLPFQGTISLSDEVALWIDTNYPSYWLVQSYSTYTSRGWATGQTRKLDVGPEGVPPPPQELKGRIPVTQTVHVGFSTNDLFAGGSLLDIDRAARVEVLTPRRFTVSLADASKDNELPEDVQLLAQEFREKLIPPLDEFLEATITRLLPYSLVLEDLQLDREELVSVTLARKEAVFPEVVSSKFASRVSQGQTYTMTSYVSVATDDELRQAGTQYPPTITDYYLHLPGTLPERVKVLAQEITQGADNPYDKAVAIQDYLRGMEYSQKIEAPSYNADGVDHFLFERRKGYSDYFASAMTVMLRAVGVPARMAAGYAPGVFDESQGLLVVRDFDSHGWTQVYFPGYGWVDFEPTPSRSVPQRQLLPEEEAGGAAGGTSLQEADDLLDEDDILIEPGNGFAPGSSGGLAGSSWWMAPVVPSSVLLGMGMAAFAVWLVWRQGLAQASPAERAYLKMSRLARLAGLGQEPQETPQEYAATLEREVPSVESQARVVAQAFEQSRYGKRELADVDESRLEQAWRWVRGRLLRRIVARLVRRR